MQKKNHITAFNMVNPPPNYAMETSSSSSNNNNNNMRLHEQSPLLLLLREGPPWLESFLNARYFDPCRYHLFSKNEKNHFCIDCYVTVKGPLCCRGLHSDHASHRTLQIRRASHADGIRVDDISKLLDISGIQTYIINNHRIVFLLRQLNKPNLGSNMQSLLTGSSGTTGPGINVPMVMNSNVMSRHCLACGRALSTDPMKFCSIKCKLVVIRQQSFAGFCHYSLMPSNFIINAASLSSLVGYREYWPNIDQYNVPSGVDVNAGHQYVNGNTHLKRKFDLSLTAENDVPDTLVTDANASKTDLNLLSPISVLRPPSSTKHETKFCKPSCEKVQEGNVNVSTHGMVKVTPEFLYSSARGMSDQRLEVALIHKMLGNYRRKRRKGMPHRAPLF